MILYHGSTTKIEEIDLDTINYAIQIPDYIFNRLGMYIVS